MGTTSKDVDPCMSERFNLLPIRLRGIDMNETLPVNESVLLCQ